MSTHSKLAVFVLLMPAALHIAGGQPISAFESRFESEAKHESYRIDTRPTWEQWAATDNGNVRREVRPREESGSVSVDQLRRPLKGKARDMILKAEQLLTKGKMAEAMALLAKAAELADARPYALSVMGTQHIKAGLYDQGIEELSEAGAVLEGSAMVHNNLAFALGIRGHFERARKEAEKALQLDPGSAKTRFILGAVLVDMGQFEEGVYHLRQAAPEIATARVMLEQVLAARRPAQPLAAPAVSFQPAK